MYELNKKSRRTLRESEVHTGCWKCSTGSFHLLGGSDYIWQCDSCRYVGYLKVIRRENSE